MRNAVLLQPETSPKRQVVAGMFAVGPSVVGSPVAQGRSSKWATVGRADKHQCQY
jgi:hypothetical protein